MADVPPRQVHDGLGVHVGLLGGSVLTPHVNVARDLADGEVKLSSAHNAPDPPLGSVKELDQPGDLQTQSQTLMTMSFNRKS